MAQWDPFKWTSKFTPTTQEQYFQPFKTASDLSKERRNDLDTREAAIDAYKPYLGDENSETYNAWKSVNDKIDQNLNELGHLGWNFNPAIHRELKSEYAKQTARLKGAVEGMQAEQKRADDFKAKNPRAVYNWRDKDGNTVYKLNADLFIDNGKVDFHQIDLEDMRKQGETLGKNISTKVADAIMADTRLSTAYYVKDGLIVSRDHKRKGIGGGFHIDWLVPTNNPEKQAMNKAEIDRYLALHPEDKEILRTLPYLQQQVQSIFDNTDFAYMDKENQTLGMNSVYLGLSQGIGNYDEDYHINAKADPRGNGGGGGGDQKQTIPAVDTRTEYVDNNNPYKAETWRTGPGGITMGEKAFDKFVTDGSNNGYALQNSTENYSGVIYNMYINSQISKKVDEYNKYVKDDTVKNVLAKASRGEVLNDKEKEIYNKAKELYDAYDGEKKKAAKEGSANFNAKSEVDKMNMYEKLKEQTSTQAVKSVGIIDRSDDAVATATLNLYRNIGSGLGANLEENEGSWFFNLFGKSSDEAAYGLWEIDSEGKEHKYGVDAKEYGELLKNLKDVRYDSKGRCCIVSIDKKGNEKTMLIKPKDDKWRAFNKEYAHIAENVTNFNSKNRLKFDAPKMEVISLLNDKNYILSIKDRATKIVNSENGQGIYELTVDTNDGDMLKYYFDDNGIVLAQCSARSIMDNGEGASKCLAQLAASYMYHDVLDKYRSAIAKGDVKYNIDVEP